MFLNNSYKGRKIYFSKMILYVSFSKEYFIMFQARIVTKSVIFNVHVFGHIYRSMALTLHGTSFFNIISNYLQMEIVFKFFHFCSYSVPDKQPSFQFSYFLRDRDSSLFVRSFVRMVRYREQNFTIHALGTVFKTVCSIT